MSESIIRHATDKARSTVVGVLGGALVILFATLIGGTVFQAEHRDATERLISAYVNADRILLTDERLTMSAKLAAATGEQRWIDRFESNATVMADAIAKVAATAPPDLARKFDAQTRASSERMVDMARKAFETVRAGDSKGAREILDSALYEYHKDIVREGSQDLADHMIAVTREFFTGIQITALVVSSAAIPLFFFGAAILWHRLNSSFRRSEGAYVEATDKIRTLAMNDVLTGLSNRLSLRQSLQSAITRAESGKTKVAVLMIDLDRFKPINDRHGHLIGDLVLKEVARRMAKVVRKSEFLGRFGGDEFVAIVEYESNDEIARRVGGRLVEVLSESMTFGGLTVDIGASVGLAIYPTNAAGDEELIRKADTALYRSKEEGRGAVRSYNASMEAALEARASLEEDLRAAVRTACVIPYFQPLIEISTGRICGFEVLSRWDHPVRGPIAPSEFIRIAEAAGIIDSLTLVVLQKACLRARSLPDGIPIAINVAPRQIQDERLADKILAVLAKTNFPAHRLEIELTENALVNDITTAKNVITTLKKAGIKVALDDFGTGYSSLCYLSELPFDKIKIDRSFIKTLHDRPESAKIVNAIIGLGKSLGVPTIAEGVESERDARVVREMGCPIGQGYYYSPAVPASDLAEVCARFAGPALERSVA